MFRIFEVVFLLYIATLCVWALALYSVVVARLSAREKGSALSILAALTLAGYYFPRFLEYLNIMSVKWLVLTNLFLGFVYIWVLLKFRAEVLRRAEPPVMKKEEKKKEQ